MKIWKSILALLTVSGISLVLTGCHSQQATTIPAVTHNTLTAMVISDDHVIAPSLHDNGKAFNQYAGNDAGADLKYSATIFKAWIAQALKTKPDVVLISGDITNNGEQASHKYVAKQLRRLTNHGIRVYTVPGNHDLNNPIARGFKGQHQYTVEATSPTQFKKIYHQAGYGQASEQDPNSLSYLVNPSKRTWFLMLNSAIYKSNYQQGNSTVGGGLTDGTLQWIAKVGRQAKKAHATLIPVLHHNTMDHTVIHQDYTIGYAEDVRKAFTSAGIKLSLTGHIHAQNIKSTNVNGHSLTDIASGALILGSHYYGTLKINQDTGTATYHATPLNVSAYIKRHDGTKAMRAYQKYDHDVLYAAGYNAALSQLYEDRDETNLSTAKVNQLARGMAAANIALFRGTAVQDSAAIQAWQKMPKETSLRGFVLATRTLHGNVDWSGKVR
ncbi:metallophosphoesterase [Lactiplantibacillus pentosus]|uniref:Lipoprotein n=1 Tax=Lactiplantibacillus pentosus IG1 TaxID=1042160 RepID=G0M0F1_LACPE|nr:metallophosphoesterase [Lactiplantibacillus pentosus]CCC18292.1 lipoprotein [Lactiplantibacillus pentosus IG1]MCT3282000.1 metallophosphoesterase [Lactiplantibacillus pentosus]MCT3304282.1 metallophosphoesterase [Lactiplantibacillus pentosus]PRO79338.1 metallophosphoesterase [Lactiplantibacillus pentosus]PRO83780.1 metallophosphoesterase [Lactiplantibacillus pentosus]